MEDKEYKKQLVDLANWYNSYRVNELVEIACCIASNNLTWDKKQLYDLDTRFDSWKLNYVKNRLHK